VLQRHPEPVPPTEAREGRCDLCHRRLLAHPLAPVQDIVRLGYEWGAGLVHRCAVLRGYRPGVQRRLAREPTFGHGVRLFALTAS
jgi:hypothetical protein